MGGDLHTWILKDFEPLPSISQLVRKNYKENIHAQKIPDASSHWPGSGAEQKKHSSSLRPLHILHSGSSTFSCRDDISMKSRFICWYFHDDMGLSHNQGPPEMPPNYLK